VQKEGDCASCSSRSDCKLADVIDKGKKACHVLLILLVLTSCSTKKNTPQSRWWHSFNARYNTYYNGQQAFIDGTIEKENGNKDNHTELLPLYAVANKQSRELGKGNFDRAIEKSQKAIKQHSIKTRPEWSKGRRKTQKDIEWLSRKEYNPFLWHAWLLMGKSQFQQGLFEEAAATFSYMTRLYSTQPAILGIARAWQAKSYVELDWLYDAEDIILKQRRDSMHFRARKDWDFTMADYYLRSEQYEQAIPYLRQVIKHEKRRKQKAREWFLMGQLQARQGNREEAYKAFRHVTRLNPPYELEFNARIAQTEVMAEGNAKRMIGRLKRMASSDNNKDYLDQVYYAIGNIYMAQKDTLQAIEAYEKGAKKATRSGIEKGVLLLTLGNIYWQREKYSDAQRCYGEAIGLLDKDRADYEQLSYRSKVLDDLAPHTSAVELQDSLQRLAKMPEEERLKVIDKLIEDLKKKEKEEQRAQEEAEAEKVLAKQAATGNRQQTNRPTTPTTAPTTGNGLWYFYNPQTVNQGKRTFEQQWGKRENADDWQRLNKTVVMANPETAEQADSLAQADGAAEDVAAPSDTTANIKPAEAADTLANDPHNREYYLAQIPFTEEQVEASNLLLQDGLFHSGIIFKDKLDNLALCERTLNRLLTDFPAYEHNDEALYHLFLLYSRQQRTEQADASLARLVSDYPESQWTILLNDPNFVENQRFGVHIEDSVYAATYDAFKGDRYDEVHANAQLSESRFPLGAHRPKFLFVEGLSLLNQGDAQGCTERLQQVVDKYPQSDVAELAGMIVKGVQQGRQLHGGKFDIGDVWSRRAVDMANDSTRTDTLHFERETKYVFLLAYQPDSVNQNQLLFEMARYNFSNYLVRNFDIELDQDANGLCRMLISGFLNYDEARQYARQLYAVEGKLATMLHACRSLIISEENLRLLGTTYSYHDYEIFFEKQIAPVEITTRPLLEEPDVIIKEADEEEEVEEDKNAQETKTENQQPADDPIFNDGPVQQSNDFPDFDEDFW
jgi:tetratricopeptide (TPR) repeat protein